MKPLLNERGWNMHWSELRVHLGMKLGAKLPKHGIPPRQLMGWTVWVEPQHPPVEVIRNGMRKKLDTRHHRVKAQCPECGAIISAGRTHQHKCGSKR